MKTLLFLLIISPTLCFGGSLWQWAPNNWTYTDDCGRTSSFWQWAPGHITTTNPDGSTTEAWEWAPGHWSITNSGGYHRP